MCKEQCTCAVCLVSEVRQYPRKGPILWLPEGKARDFHSESAAYAPQTRLPGPPPPASGLLRAPTTPGSLEGEASSLFPVGHPSEANSGLCLQGAPNRHFLKAARGRGGDHRDGHSFMGWGDHGHGKHEAADAGSGGSRGAEELGGAQHDGPAMDCRGWGGGGETLEQLPVTP